MNIYFDFEATQFSERVISIGAVCEYGEFGCLVSSFSKKITPYITKLTGITKEMVKGAPTAEEAFSDLRDWLNLMSIEDSVLSCHCYGDSDKKFLYNTAKEVKNQDIAKFIRSLADSLLDDSRIVTHYLKVSAIGVHKALQQFDDTIPPQDHDPVNDAIILSNLMRYIDRNFCIDPTLYIIVKKSKPKVKKNKDNKKYQIVVKHKTEKQAKERVFMDYNAAAQWMYNKIKKNHPDAKIETIMKNIIKAIEQNCSYANWIWEKQYI